MKKGLLVFLCLAMVSTSFCQETAVKRSARRGEAAGYSSRDASVLSMMGWGFGLAVAIATLCAFFSESSGGGGNHAH